MDLEGAISDNIACCFVSLLEEGTKVVITICIELMNVLAENSPCVNICEHAERRVVFANEIVCALRGKLGQNYLQHWRFLKGREI